GAAGQHARRGQLSLPASTPSASASCGSAIHISSGGSDPTPPSSRVRSRHFSMNARGGLPRSRVTMLHKTDFEPHYDVIIVGARCAGAATAMLLAKAGLRVLAVDRQAYGSDTLSTHALMRPAVMQLSRWGLLEPLIRTDAPV